MCEARSLERRTEGQNVGEQSFWPKAKKKILGARKSLKLTLNLRKWALNVTPISLNFKL